MVVAFEEIGAAKKVEPELRGEYRNLVARSAQQVLALDRASMRAQASGARQQLRKTKGETVGRASGTAGKSKS
jgi:hypothetical protein